MKNSYLTLPDIFYSKQTLLGYKNSEILHFNKELAKKLGLDELSEDEILKKFSGQQLFEGSSPIALNYAGHQFGHFVDSLGDGRAVLLGQINGFDIQLKGSGQTKYSRRGDGKYPLKAAIKEYIISEALYYLGVVTTRVLALIKTNEPVIREEIESGAVLTRVAKSHIRFGSFEYFAGRNDLENIKILADFVIDEQYQHLKDKENPYFELYREVYHKQIDLVTSWMSFGFIHGVMNTDNSLISGEAIDFGPCAFMDEYKKHQTFSYIDQHGRYSYQNQKPIILWNLARFAESIVPLIDNDLKKAVLKIEEFIANFSEEFDKKYYQKMLKKIGLVKDNNKNRELLDEFLEKLEANNLDFTNSFRNLSAQKSPSQLQDWFEKLKKQNPDYKLMDEVNPIYIPRNHIIAKVSEKPEELERFLELLKNPFSKQDIDDYYQIPPKNSERVRNTFCGT